MIINNYLLLSKDEYDALNDYKGNYYGPINVLLNKLVTRREKNGRYIKYRVTPKNQEEFRNIIEEIKNLYSAIRKNYILNGRKQYSKTLFRGVNTGATNRSFLSTSNSIITALGFAEQTDGVLLAIEGGDVPYIDFNQVMSPQTGGVEDEPEILFLPCIMKIKAQISREEMFDIARKQGEQIPKPKTLIGEKYSPLRKLVRYPNIKFETVVLEQEDYSKEKSNLSFEDLLEEYEQYYKDLDMINSSKETSEEYKVAYQRILKFKEDFSTFIHKNFHEINQNIDNQLDLKSNRIEISPEHNVERVFIGNTGQMYKVQDKMNGKEYYFKPAISKDGLNRPYRAYIQESAYHLQQIINPENAIKCNTIEMNGMFGAIQEKVPIDVETTRTFIEYFDRGKGELSPEIINQIMDEYLVDFCLCNYDSHASNFIIDKNGKLRGIDKEQSFRYIKEDKNRDMMFAINYNEKYGENPPIYYTLFEQIKQGKLSHKYLDILEYRASRLSQYPDEEYRKIFEQYAYGKAKNSEDAELLLDSILDRKRNILKNINQLSNEVYNQWYKNQKITLYKIEEATQGVCAEAINDTCRKIKEKIKEKNINEKNNVEE